MRADTSGYYLLGNGLETSQTPLVGPSEFNEKTRTAAFRIALPLETFAPGRYTLQVVVVEPGDEQAAFARAFFALRQPTARNAAVPAPNR